MHVRVHVCMCMCGCVGVCLYCRRVPSEDIRGYVYYFSSEHGRKVVSEATT